MLLVQPFQLALDFHCCDVEMTPERIAELKALAEKATAGPWEPKWIGIPVVGYRMTAPGKEPPIAGINNYEHKAAVISDEYKHHDWAKVHYTSEELQANAEFIAAARTALPEALAALEQAQRERDAANHAAADASSWATAETRRANEMRLRIAELEAELAACRERAFAAAVELITDRDFRERFWNDEPNCTPGSAIEYIAEALKQRGGA